MATKEVQKKRQLRLFNSIVFGFAQGLYDLFGESALVTVDSIGESLIDEMEQEMGLEIAGEEPRDILTEIERLLIDEYGLVEDIDINLQEEQVEMVCENCLLWKATESLRGTGAPPYTCVPMTLGRIALRKRLGKKGQFVSIEQDMDNRICNLTFKLL
jgi:hypothetical protein